MMDSEDYNVDQDDHLFGPPHDSYSLVVFPPAWDKYCN
jgi:hypothetical protein